MDSLSFPFLLLIVVTAGYFYFSQPAQPMTVIPISQLGQDVQSGTVKKISVNGTLLNVTYRDGRHGNVRQVNR